MGEEPRIDDPREAVYDAEIAPLMTQIIALCKAHSIPMVASFQLTRTVTPEEEEDGEEALFCTTAIVPLEASQTLKDAVHVLYDRWRAVPQFQAFAITTREAGSG